MIQSYMNEFEVSQTYRALFIRVLVKHDKTGSILTRNLIRLKERMRSCWIKRSPIHIFGVVALSYLIYLEYEYTK